MEGHSSTGQSPQWAVVPMEEEEEEYILCVCAFVCMCCVRAHVHTLTYVVPRTAGRLSLCLNK